MYLWCGQHGAAVWQRHGMSGTPGDGWMYLQARRPCRPVLSGLVYDALCEEAQHGHIASCTISECQLGHLLDNLNEKGATQPFGPAAYHANVLLLLCSPMAPSTIQSKGIVVICSNNDNSLRQSVCVNFCACTTSTQTTLYCVRYNLLGNDLDRLCENPAATPE